MQVPEEARKRCCIDGCWNKSATFDGRCLDHAPSYEY